MKNVHTREQVLADLKGESTIVVATHSGQEEIRTRKMHCFYTDDFSVYLASLKNDPKTIQITYHPMVSLLAYVSSETLTESNEIEIFGKAIKVHDEAEKFTAFTGLQKVSPVVKHFVETRKTDLLEIIKVSPYWIKYRNFTEIIQGIPPTVLDFPEKKKERGDLEPALLVRKLKIWWMELRPSFLLASIVPILLGAFVAWSKKSEFSWTFLLLTLFGGVLLHMGTNMLNDFFDHKSRNDENNHSFVRPFSGGSRMIQLGLLTPLEVLSASLLCFASGAFIGTYLAWTRGWLILVIGLIGVISGFFYTASPFKFANRGLGELLVGLNFGLLMVLGSYFVQVGQLDWEPVIAALPVTFLITAVVYINEFPDYEADRAAGKATLVVRLGRKRAVNIYIAFMCAAYISILAGTISGIVNPYTLLGLLSLPLAIKAIRHALIHYDRPFDLVPTNVSTIMAHLITGALCMAGYIIEHAGIRGLSILLPLVIATGLVLLWLLRHIDKQQKAFTGLRAIVSS